MGSRQITKPLSTRQVLLQKIAQYDLDRWEVNLLLSVPLRGTQQWNDREMVRKKCGANTISWGFIPEECDRG